MSYIEQFWRNATAADVTRVMDGETVEARFRDSDKQAWENSRLAGWQDLISHWLDQDCSGWACCQVYDPPQCWLDKPDPGEGYRLLNKFPDEELQPGDEAFDLLGDGKWESSLNLANGSQRQSEGVWYRRKIEQPNPDPGEGYRLLGKFPDEEVQAGDCIQVVAVWTELVSDCHLKQMKGFWYRRRIEQPKPEPKHYTLQVGDTAETPSGHRIKVTESGIEVQ